MPKGKILAIDDESFFRNLFTEILTEAGYEVVTAENGEAGLRRFSSDGPFDIVITDMAMTGMNGIETMEAVKRINPGQAVVIVTGIGDVQLAVNAMKKGVTDYILKPINPEDFLHLIKTTLENRNLLSEHSKLLSENIEYFSMLSVYQRCLRILSVLDTDRLMDMVLDSVMAESGAQTGIFWLLSPDNRNELKLGSTRGRVNRSLEPESVILSDAWAASIKAGKPFYGKGSKGAADEGVLYLPLKLDDTIVGLVKVMDKTGGGKFDVRDLMVSKTISGFAAIAVGNALKVRDMETGGFKDPKSNIYHINYFNDYVAKEIKKARRYQRTFSIICLRVENYAELSKAFSGKIIEGSLQGVTGSVLNIIRDADIFAKMRPDEYWLLLPETDYFGSLMSSRKIVKALNGKEFVSEGDKNGRMEFTISSVSFPQDGENHKALFNVARKRIEERKKSLYHSMSMSGMDYWSIFNLITGREDDYPLSMLEGKGLNSDDRTRFEDREGLWKPVLFSGQVVSRVHEIILNEIEMKTDKRGIFYLGAWNIETLVSLLSRHPLVERSATKIFLLGGKTGKGWSHPAVTPVFVDDGRMEKSRFLIFLSEEYAYAFFLKERSDGMYCGVHTSDPVFVENVIAKLQESYSLQVQL